MSWINLEYLEYCSIFRQLRRIIHCEPPRYCFHIQQNCRILQLHAASLFLCPFSGQVRSVASGRVVNGFLGNDWVGPSDLIEYQAVQKNAVIPRDMARCWRSCIDTWSLILRRLRSPRLLRKCPQPACNQPWQSYHVHCSDIAAAISLI